MMLVALSLAVAGYSLDDVVAASGRGMSEESVRTIASSVVADGPLSLTTDEAAGLLRAGVSPEIIGLLTGGAEPTPTTLAAAKQTGPAYEIVVPERLLGEIRTTDAEQLVFEAVDSSPGLDAAALFRRANRWMEQTTQDSSDRNHGPVLTGTVLLPFEQSFADGFDATRGVLITSIRVASKDGKYKVTIGPFQHDTRGFALRHPVSFGFLRNLDDPGRDQCTPRAPCASAGWRLRVWGELLNTARKGAFSLIRALRIAMKTTEEQVEDW